MNTLFVLKGSPGSGKSYFLNNLISEHKELKHSILSPDELRKQMFGIYYDENMNKQIPHNNKLERGLWSLFMDTLKLKMSVGGIIIIDATHIRLKNINKYKELSELYNYEIVVVDFNETLENKLLNNSMKLIGKLPKELVIEKHEQEQNMDYKMLNRMYSVISPNVMVNYIKRTILNKYFLDLRNTDIYDNIFTISDIHGDYDQFIEIMKNNHPKDNPNTLYVFLGDYVDRGNKNREVIQYLLDIVDLPNVILLKGNHEIWLQYYSNNGLDDIRSKEFKNNTIPQLEGFQKSTLKHLCKKMLDFKVILYTKNDINYKLILTHGGVLFDFFSDKTLIELSTMNHLSNFILGYGGYNFNIDEKFYSLNPNTYQIHGHRNSFGVGIDEYKKSINLESGNDKIRYYNVKL